MVERLIGLRKGVPSSETWAKRFADQYCIPLTRPQVMTLETYIRRLPTHDHPMRYAIGALVSGGWYDEMAAAAGTDVEQIKEWEKDTPAFGKLAELLRRWVLAFHWELMKQFMADPDSKAAEYQMVRDRIVRMDPSQLRSMSKGRQLPIGAMGNDDDDGAADFERTLMNMGELAQENTNGH